MGLAKLFIETIKANARQAKQDAIDTMPGIGYIRDAGQLLTTFSLSWPVEVRGDEARALGQSRNSILETLALAGLHPYDTNHTGSHLVLSFRTEAEYQEAHRVLGTSGTPVKLEPYPFGSQFLGNRPETVQEGASYSEAVKTAQGWRAAGYVAEVRGSWLFGYEVEVWRK